MAKKKQRKDKSAKAKRASVRKARPQAAPKAAPVKALQFPLTAHVAKGGDKIPVQVKDQSHLDRLKAEHGEASVEVSE